MSTAISDYLKALLALNHETAKEVLTVAEVNCEGHDTEYHRRARARAQFHVETGQRLLDELSEQTDLFVLQNELLKLAEEAKRWDQSTDFENTTIGSIVNYVLDHYTILGLFPGENSGMFIPKDPSVLTPGGAEYAERQTVDAAAWAVEAAAAKRYQALHDELKFIRSIDLESKWVQVWHFDISNLNEKVLTGKRYFKESLEVTTTLDAQVKEKLRVSATVPAGIISTFVSAEGEVEQSAGVQRISVGTDKNEFTWEVDLSTLPPDRPVYIYQRQTQVKMDGKLAMTKACTKLPGAAEVLVIL
ncbi:hypothetical protein TSOC_006242 [Tetrabaena socialis]|uniref:Uncharacterized protein n=1 Tax=Tetrabaena socialis TaxID=47790 RepID=A0A2J8A4B8_9CHLO|nr:hypothetical protein TSOC_006242 [Tetrabaena socialis]|eukprot:PNH07371.1 hypothetical protein TSOC_006242 [Tetrabaena socialis]